MDRYTKSNISRGFNRSNDIEVSKELRSNIERAASLHLLAGNMTQYMLAMNSLAKIDTQASLIQDVNDLKDAVTRIAASTTDTDNS